MPGVRRTVCRRLDGRIRTAHANAHTVSPRVGSPRLPGYGGGGGSAGRDGGCEPFRSRLTARGTAQHLAGHYTDADFAVDLMRKAFHEDNGPLRSWMLCGYLNGDTGATSGYGDDGRV